MQGRLAVLETKSAETSSSHEVYGIESSGRADETGTRSVFAKTEDDNGVLNEHGEQSTHHKRACSQSSHSGHRFSTKEPDEDPSYRQFLALVRDLLDLTTPEEFKEVPSKILPMCLPPVEEINSRWVELEKKVAGNPSEASFCTF